MISTLKTEQGLIYAYIEWKVVNEIGKETVGGEYIYIADLWIHDWYRLKNVIKLLIPKIHEHEFSYNVNWIYWTNLKHKERKTPAYSRFKLARKGQYGQQEG